jgi:hypothetical protein
VLGGRFTAALSMRTILIHLPGHGDGRLFDPAARDSVNEPFIHLRDRLAARGYALETADERPLEGCERLLLWDFPPGLVRPPALRRLRRMLRRRLRGSASPPPVRPLYCEAIEAGLRERMAFCTGEPPVVLPANWDPATHARFDTILTWNDRYAGAGKYRKFCWPVTQHIPRVEPVAFARKRLLVNISANKRSDHPQDLYRERRAAIRHFEKATPDQFDLYGVGWDAPGEPPYPSYRGTVPHKWDVFPRYRFALCYENMRDEPGWITEKIFDCMRADSVPIYWGAANVESYIDPAAFVDRRRFQSHAELERFLREMTEADYERHRGAIRDYLASAAFARFLSPAFAETVIGALGLER